MAKFLKILVIVVVIALAGLTLKPSIENFWSQFMGFVAPHGKYTAHMLEKWSTKPTDFLINKLQHPSIEFSGVAKNILVQRKDLSKEDAILKIIDQSKNYRSKYLALAVLFAWDEAQAVDLSMAILKEGRKNPLFSDALLHLSKRKHEPAYPYAMALAEEKDKYENGSAAYIADFGKIESLPILEKMLSETSDGLYKKMILTAIETIKNDNGLKR